MITLGQSIDLVGIRNKMKEQVEMKEFRDKQRYSIEKAQEEARILKLMIELGEFGCRNYNEAEFYLPEFYVDQANIDGVETNQNPIKDSEWGLWGEIDMLPEFEEPDEYEQEEYDDLKYELACDEEDRDLYCPIHTIDQLQNQFLG